MRSQQKWQDALGRFLVPWKRRREVTGALVCGSYVTGNPSPRSDLDVHILLAGGTKWRERGNQIIDGFMVEYFANPPNQIRRYFKDDHGDNCMSAQTMFVTGNVIFDKAGDVKRLQAEAARWLRRPYRAVKKQWIQLKKYSLWDMLDNLLDTSDRQSPDLPFVYFVLLDRVKATYACFLRQPLWQTEKAYALLTDVRTQMKYLHDKFQDRIFAELFAAAMCETDPRAMLPRAKRIVEHVLKKMGGFDVDGWRFRSPVEI